MCVHWINRIIEFLNSMNRTFSHFCYHVVCATVISSKVVRPLPNVKMGMRPLPTWRIGMRSSSWLGSNLFSDSTFVYSFVFSMGLLATVSVALLFVSSKMILTEEIFVSVTTASFCASDSTIFGSVSPWNIGRFYAGSMIIIVRHILCQNNFRQKNFRWYAHTNALHYISKFLKLLYLPPKGQICTEFYQHIDACLLNIA